MQISTYTTSALAAAMLLAGAHARSETAIGENLTVSGFLDMSATVNDTDAGTESTASFDQWEVNFAYDFNDGIKAFVDLNDIGDGAEIEQAYITADLGNGFGAQAGLFLTPHGYEGAEPINLWQYSYSATIIGYAGYANGAALTWGNDLVSLYAAAVDGSYSGDQDADDLSIEGQIKVFPMEGLTLQAAYASEKFDAVIGDDVLPGVGSYEQGIINFWAEYATGSLTVAAEYNSLLEIGGPDGDGDGYLFMANYAFTDKFAVTVRYSGAELDNGYENTEFTLSPSYTFTDTLFGLLEFRTDEYDDSSLDGESYAAELIYTF